MRKNKINLRAKNAGSRVKVEGCSPFSALARLRHARENLEKRASGNITTISQQFTWVDKNARVEIQLKSVCASVN